VKKMNLNRIAFSLLIYMLSQGAFAQSIDHKASPNETKQAFLNNDLYHSQERNLSNPQPWRPVEDAAQMSYVLVSSESQTNESDFLRKAIAQNLPVGVKLVVLTQIGFEDAVRRKYSAWISPDRLLIVSDSNIENGFWARDAFPYPVYSSGQKEVALIGAKYYRNFHSGPAIAKGVNAASYRPEAFTFVGGNLLSDEEGNCFSVNSQRLFKLTEEDLKAAYGCKSVHLMKHVAGLGDVDEVLKPLSGRRILSNAPQYKAQLEALGYQVISLPAIANSFRTYVNSLIIRDTVFMPSYGGSLDQKAAAVYQNLGYKVVLIPSSELSDSYHGSVHCQIMAYPAMNEQQLVWALKAH
jgi:hypothetical protein